MKWLKLDCDFRNDPKIRALTREWGGQEAAGFWALLLSFIGAHGGPECRVKIDSTTEYSDQYLADWFASKPQVIVKRLSRAAQLSLICATEWENNRIIFIPNMLKRIDDYTRRVRTRSEHCPEKHATEEEVEEEREVEKEKKKTLSASADAGDGFVEFWETYPRKTEKLEARKIWKRLRPSMELRKTIVEAIGRQKLSAEWIKENGQFIPNPAKWLRRGNWEDQPVGNLFMGASSGTHREGSGDIPGGTSDRRTSRGDPIYIPRQ